MFMYMHLLWLLAATVCAEEELPTLPCESVNGHGQQLHGLLTSENCPRKFWCRLKMHKEAQAEEKLVKEKTCACALRFQFEKDHVRVEYPFLYEPANYLVKKPSTVETIKDLYKKSMNGHRNKWYCGQVWGEPFADDCDLALGQSDEGTYPLYTQVYCVCTPEDGDGDCRAQVHDEGIRRKEEGIWVKTALEAVNGTVSQSENSGGKEDGLYLHKCKESIRSYPGSSTYYYTYYEDCERTSNWTLSDPDKEQPDQILACLIERADDPQKDCSNIPQFAPNTTTTTTITSATTTTLQTTVVTIRDSPSLVTIIPEQSILPESKTTNTSAPTDTLQTTVVTIIPEQSIHPESKTTISTWTNATTDDKETNRSNTTSTTSTTSTTIDEPSKTTSASNGTTNAPAAPNSESEPGASSKGWIAAIVVCLILLLIAAAVGVFFFLKKRKQQKEKEKKAAANDGVDYVLNGSALENEKAQSEMADAGEGGESKTAESGSLGDVEKGAAEEEEPVPSTVSKFNAGEEVKSTGSRFKPSAAAE